MANTEPPFDSLDAVLVWMRLLGTRMWWCGCGDLTTTGERCDACRDIDRLFPETTSDRK